MRAALLPVRADLPVVPDVGLRADAPGEHRVDVVLGGIVRPVLHALELPELQHAEGLDVLGCHRLLQIGRQEGIAGIDRREPDVLQMWQHALAVLVRFGGAVHRLGQQTYAIRQVVLEADEGGGLLHFGAERAALERRVRSVELRAA